MKRRPYERVEESAITVLTREQDRALRAAAWQHVRRIIGAAKASALRAQVKARVNGD